MNAAVYKNPTPIGQDGIEELAARNGAEVIAVSLSSNKHVHFVRLKDGAIAMDSKDFTEERFSVFTMGRDPFMLISKIEAVFKELDAAKTCAFIASVVQINSLVMGEGKVGWELELIGWWIPVKILSARESSK